MGSIVQVKDIVGAFEMLSDESRGFVNRETGEVEVVPLDLLGAAEDGEEEMDLPKWQEDEWELVKRIVRSDAFLRLPTKFDINDWQIMNAFAQSEQDPIREKLLNALHGRGAFRYFKDTVHRHGIQEKWYAYRDQALREIAIEWCEEHNLEWR